MAVASEFTGADAVRWYMTGASLDGGYQGAQAASLGGYRSGVRVGGLGFARRSLVRGVRLEYVSGSNGVGVGSLVAQDEVSLSWAAPGGSAGPAVLLAEGQTRMLVDGTDSDRFVLVTRTSSLSLVGSESVHCYEVVGNVLGGSNVSGSQSASGVSLYRSVYGWLPARSSYTTAVVRVTPRAGSFGGTWLAKDVLSVGAMRSYVDEETGVGGVYTSAGVAKVWELGAGEDRFGFVLKRVIGAGTSASAVERVVLDVEYELDGELFTDVLVGRFRIAEAGLSRYLVWVGAGESPDLGAAADYEGDTLPIETGAVAAGQTYYVICRAQNEYGLVSQNDEPQAVEVSPAGQNVLRPTRPRNVSVASIGGGAVSITGFYNGRDDESGRRADTWVIWLTSDGSWPEPDWQAPYVEVPMGGWSFGEEVLSYSTEGGILEDAPVRVLVRTRRSGTPPVDSLNEGLTVGTVEWWDAARVDVPLAALDRRESLEQGPSGLAETITYIDEGLGVYWQQLEGETRLWAGDVLVWNLRYRSDGGECALLTTFGLRLRAVSGVASGFDVPAEIGVWNAGSQEIHLNVNGSRVATVDVVAETITVEAWDGRESPSATLSASACWPKFGHTCFQVWDVATDWHVTALGVTSDGVMQGGLVGWVGKATQAECL